MNITPFLPLNVNAVVQFTTTREGDQEAQVVEQNIKCRFSRAEGTVTLANGEVKTINATMHTNADLYLREGMGVIFEGESYVIIRCQETINMAGVPFLVYSELEKKPWAIPPEA